MKDIRKSKHQYLRKVSTKWLERRIGYVYMIKKKAVQVNNILQS